jgi:hypothetical protein
VTDWLDLDQKRALHKAYTNRLKTDEKQHNIHKGDNGYNKIIIHGCMKMNLGKKGEESWNRIQE